MRIKVSFFFFALLFSLFISHSYTALALLLAATLHELGHMLAAKICNIPLGELKLGIFGASLTPSSELLSYKGEILLALAGPASNLICVGATAYLINICPSPFLSLFAAASLFLALLNLLPIDDLDGGRILRCALMLLFSPDTVAAICRAISFLLVFLLWIISAYLLLRHSPSLSLFTFSLSLFCKIFLKQKN